MRWRTPFNYLSERGMRYGNLDNIPHRELYLMFVPEGREGANFYGFLSDRVPYGSSGSEPMRKQVGKKSRKADIGIYISDDADYLIALEAFEREYGDLPRTLGGWILISMEELPEIQKFLESQGIKIDKTSKIEEIKVHYRYPTLKEFERMVKSFERAVEKLSRNEKQIQRKRRR